MRTCKLIAGLGLILVTSAAVAQSSSVKKTAVERGRDAAIGHAPMNPPTWTMAGYENVWKQWGLKEKPADFEEKFRRRYGLHPAPYENNRLPMGLHVSKGLLGKGVVNDCLMCHANVIAGETVIGAGNASLDLQSLFTELSAASGASFKMPFHFSHVRGTIDPVSPLAFLMEFRDGNLNVSFNKNAKLDYFENVCSDPPAWWLLKKKTTRQWTGNMDARSMRVDMVNLLTPFNSAAHIKKHESVFADIHAFVTSTPVPKYPFEIDHKLAARGQKIFNDTCARCHGTYGPDAKYPNKIVSLKIIGTDPVLATALTQKNIDFYNNSWFAQETGPEGQFFRVVDRDGYQAPPLDGVWATAPYLHNASAPTVYHVLNSKARPKYFTRSYKTERDDYDAVKLGWKITVLKRAPNPKMPGVELRKIYDTTRPGQSNAGHTFGDALNEAQRAAVIEYLKTL